MSPPDAKQPFVQGTIQTEAGEVPRVTATLTVADRWGSIKARWGVGRMQYKIDPGLYALGSPGPQSPVLVTANYKMSFDRLRAALPGRDAWILVLNTQGINVWCAAGKGTFGTDELVRRIASSKVDRVVTHRKVILPQLAGPGVAAHQVRKISGFRAVFGPIRAEDLPAFLNSGLKATAEMRRKTFKTKERAVLIPVELMAALKWAMIISPLIFFLGGFGGDGNFWDNALDSGLFAVLGIMVAVTAGAVVTPLLLPWLPGRAFTTKGIIAGLFAGLILALFRMGDLGTRAGDLETFSWFLLAPAIAGFLAMNFTGASTYTSLSGVKKEMKWAVPFEIVACSLGFMMWMGARFLA